jgi:site-specific recombinase XerD
VRAFLADRDPLVVTRREVEDFMHRKSDKPWVKGKDGRVAVATMNKRLSALGSLYRYASTYIPQGETEPIFQRANPASGIVRGKPERSPKGLTVEEMRRLFSVIPQDTLLGIRDKAIFTFAFYTARRREEIASLNYGDIQPASFPDRRDGWVYYFRGKGAKSLRDCAELPQPAKDSLDWYLIASGRSDDMLPESPLFASVGRPLGMGGNVKLGEVRRMTGKAMGQQLKKYLKLAGLDESISMHSFRHASAKARHDAGEDILSIQALLRHSNLQTTHLYLKSLSGTEDHGYRLLEAKFGQFL